MKKYILISMLLIFAVTLLSGQTGNLNPDLNATAAKVLLQRLIVGDQAVAKQIKWTDLMVYDYSWFSKYEKLSTEAQRLAFQKDFIAKFATLGDKITPSQLTNWRTSSVTAQTITIFARGADFDFVMVFERNPTGNLLYHLYTFYDDDMEYEDW